MVLFTPLSFDPDCPDEPLAPVHFGVNLEEVDGFDAARVRSDRKRGLRVGREAAIRPRPLSTMTHIVIAGAVSGVNAVSYTAFSMIVMWWTTYKLYQSLVL